MNKKYFLAIDEGTTGVRAIIFDRAFNLLGSSYEHIQVVHPVNVYSEQDAEEMYSNTVRVCRNVVRDLDIDPNEIACVGITTQRATWAVWDKKTGRPVRNMVTWIDARAKDLIGTLKADPVFVNKFPLVAELLKPSQTCMSLRATMDIEPEFNAMIQNKEVMMGTPDTWLIYKFTEGKVHATCSSNASSTGAYDMKTLDWDKDYMDYLSIPIEIFPEIKNEADNYGYMSKEILGVEIPITGVAADQQSALFAQGCHEIDTAKCTNGTGTFISVNIGKEYKDVKPPYSIRVAWTLGKETSYMVEGYSITAGAAIQWLQDKIKMFDDVTYLNTIVDSVPNSNGVYFVPALAGLAMPYFDYNARASFMGLGANNTNVDMIRAVVESVAYAGAMIFEDMKEKCGSSLKEIKVSGGVSKSSIVSPYLSNLTGAKIEKPDCLEASALGAVQFAAIYLGLITRQDVVDNIKAETYFEPDENQEVILKQYAQWKRAVERSLAWIEN